MFTTEIIRGVAELKIIEDEYLLYPEERTIIQWKHKYNSLSNLIKKQRFTNSENQILFTRLVKNHSRIKYLFSQIIDLYRNSDLSGKKENIVNNELKDRLVTLLLESSQEMVSCAFHLNINIEKRILHFIRKILIIGLILLSLISSFIIYHSLYIKRRISSAIEKLLEGTGIIGNGNLDYKIKTDSDDEFNLLAKAFNNMTEQLKESTTSITKLNWEILNRKRIEKELKKKEEELNLILDSPPIMIFYKDIEGRYLFVNKAFSEAIGKPREKIVGKKSSDIFSKEIADQLNKHDRELIKSGKQELRTVEKYETPQGIRWAKVLKVPLKVALYDKTGKHITIVGFAEDITEQKILEEEKQNLETQLFQSQKMEAIGRLTGGIAHDFNNMLTIILGYSDFILSKIDESNQLYQPLQEMKKAAIRSAELTQKLLAFSRQQIINPRRLNLNEELRDMEKLLRRIIGEDIKLEFVLADELWDIFLDPTQLNQIVLNMVVNSRDAMPDGGTITIETQNVSIDDNYCIKHLGFTPGDYVMFAISDTGIGIDKEILPHIFEPFFTTKGIGKGTGLGLSTVYGIVKQNKGYINCYSEPGRGTTFKIYFPKHIGDKEKASITDSEAKISTGHETILLVEDEDIVREFTKDVLMQLGYNVLEASDPEEAINLCKDYDKDIHLILTDVVMPNMDGKKLYEEISTIRPSIKVLFMSGYTANAIAHKGVLENGTQFIHKPFTMNSLAKKVREILDEKR